MAKAQVDNTEFLSLDDIDGIADEVFDTVHVPEWKGDVRIGSLSAEEVVLFYEGNDDPAKKRFAGSRLIVKSIVDKNGKRIGREDQIPRISKKNSKGINRVVNAIMMLNGMGKDSELEKVKNEPGSSEVAIADSPTS